MYDENKEENFMRKKEIFKQILLINIFIYYFYSLKGNFTIGLMLTLFFSNYLKKEEDLIFKIITMFFTLYTFYLLYLKIYN